MTVIPRSLLWLVLPVLVCVWSDQAAAARWQEHRTAAIRAIEEVDYDKAIEQLGAAIYYARKLPAADRDVAELWENLTAVYLADAQLGRAWESIGHWDKVLVANAGQPWAAEQQSRLDQMTRILFKETRMTDGQTDGRTGGAAEQTGEPNGNSAEQPGASPSRALAPAGGPATAAAAPAEEPGGYGIHLASFSNETNARRGWAELQARYPDLLKDKTFVLRPVDLGDRGIFVRLIARPFPDPASAHAACRDLQRRSQYCAVMPLG
jgi:SPOR domain